jgi:nucleotide-binding universal stress UspA family protein
MNTNAFIAVGYDGSSDSGAALSWAARIAILRQEAIVVTIVIDPTENPRGIGWPSSWWNAIEDSARAVLDEFSGLEYRVARHAGNKVSVLSEAGYEASMLVVGSHGHSVVGQVFLGSVSQSLARHARPPVVVVREPRTPDAGRIVVGYDGMEPSTRALEFACTMAELTGDKLGVTHAWEPTYVRSGPWQPIAAPMARYGYTPGQPGTIAIHRDQETTFYPGSYDVQRVRVEAAVEQLRAAHPTTAVYGDVVEASPARALLDASMSASLIVVGSHGRNAVAETLLGSVSHAVLHRAHCPVAVVK